MYKSFRVKNFRCFKDLQINDLGRVNLIAGKNNTGKTALMEAMYLHTGNRDPKTLLRSELREVFGYYRNYRPHDTEEDLQNIVGWHTVFHRFDISKPIELTGGYSLGEQNLFDEAFDSSVAINFKSLDSHDIDDILHQFRIDDFDRFMNMEILQLESDYDRKSSYLAILNGRVLPSRSRSQRLVRAEFIYAHETLEPLINANRFSSMRQSDYFAYLIEALQIIEPDLQGLELLHDGTRPILHAYVALDQLLSLAHMGDGINRLSSLILAMGEVAGGAIFVDEIENGIHHKIQKKLWSVLGKFARDAKMQVFATTHSYEMIEAAHEAFQDDDPYEFRFHRLNRRNDDDHKGEIEAITYNKAGVEAFIRSNYEVRG